MNNVQGNCTEVHRYINHWNYTDYKKFAEFHVADIAADNLLEAIDNKKYKDSITADINNDRIFSWWY